MYVSNELKKDEDESSLVEGDCDYMLVSHLFLSERIEATKMAPLDNAQHRPTRGTCGFTHSILHTA